MVKDISENLKILDIMLPLEYQLWKLTPHIILVLFYMEAPRKSIFISDFGR